MPENAPTIGEALASLRAEAGFEADTARTWRCRLGPVTLRLPNFGWRRDAIFRHDLHHVITGYPCTMRGEFQMAAWEFAAGRYPHPAATAFCAPLVLAGLLWSPGSIWRAFLAGRRSRSLYGRELTEELLRSPLAEWRALKPSPPQGSRPGDRAAFAALIIQAFVIVLSPALAGALVCAIP